MLSRLRRNQIIVYFVFWSTAYATPSEFSSNIKLGVCFSFVSEILGTFSSRGLENEYAKSPGFASWWNGFRRRAASSKVVRYL